MRTRSSRFFVILLHLLGVSNHYPQPSAFYDWATAAASGIVGVQPSSIVMERVNLQQLGGLDGVEWFQQQQLEQKMEPFWLQDSMDGKCLGPSGGFSECGDATLWFIQRKEQRKKLLRMGLFGVEEEDRDELEPYSYSLKLADMNFEKVTIQEGGQQLEHQEQKQQGMEKNEQLRDRLQRRFARIRGSGVDIGTTDDCLVPSKRIRNGKPGSLSLSSCSARKQAWAWRVNEQGVLYEMSVNKKIDNPRCLWRFDESRAVLDDCSEGFLDEESLEPGRLVQFTLVRYRATSVPTTEDLHSSYDADTNGSDLEVRGKFKTKNKKIELEDIMTNGVMEQDQEQEPEPEQEPELELEQEEDGVIDGYVAEAKEGNSSAEGNAMILNEHLPRMAVDIAHSHASDPVPHHEPKLGGSRLFLSSHEKKDDGKPFFPFAMLKDTNPILFIGGEKNENRDGKTISATKTTTIETTPSISSGFSSNLKPNDALYKLRRIEIHPYIKAAKDEVWVDPLTGLDYPTDLCRYLGHDPKDSGRHTLMGVGQYMRTMLKIKVYGIALYVSKRDALADPALEKYASLSAEELRNRPEFYRDLRHLSSADPSNSGTQVDRTLLLKTNMQLSTETMRSSLDADWKMLTDESKNLLINSSLQPRPATETMLKKIKSPDNPSRCSCSQTAPPEYEADPTCCARGTELGFTWRKNGDLEVRLNGFLMDIFPKTDLAQAIFFEYLRTDDPMSLDFIERVVDGFPFLLAPLAQVKGVSSSVLHAQQQHQQHSSHSNHHIKLPQNLVGLKDAFGSLADTISIQAGDLADNIHNGAMGMADSAVNTVRSMGDAARNFGEEVDRRRDMVLKQMSSSLPHHSHHYAGNMIMNLFVGKDRNALIHLNDGGDEDDNDVDPGARRKRRHAPRGRAFRYPLSRWLGETYQAPDEIGPMIHPTMSMTRKIFLALVHLYLLLLLIVSFPGSYHTRTKMVVRRHSNGKSYMLDSESETSLSAASMRSYSSAYVEDEMDCWYRKEVSSKLSSSSHRHRRHDNNTRIYSKSSSKDFFCNAAVKSSQRRCTYL